METMKTVREHFNAGYFAKHLSEQTSRPGWVQDEEAKTRGEDRWTREIEGYGERVLWCDPVYASEAEDAKQIGWSFGITFGAYTGDVWTVYAGWGPVHNPSTDDAALNCHYDKREEGMAAIEIVAGVYEEENDD